MFPSARGRAQAKKPRPGKNSRSCTVVIGHSFGAWVAYAVITDASVMRSHGDIMGEPLHSFLRQLYLELSDE